MQIDHKEIVEGESTLICNRCILPNSFPRINFDEQGVCSICRDYNRDFANWRAQLPWKRKVLNKICKEAKAKHKEYDALIPLSGGKDSTYVLYVAHKELGLKCLAYTLDFGYLSDFAKLNIETSCRKLGGKPCILPHRLEIYAAAFCIIYQKDGLVLFRLYESYWNEYKCCLEQLQYSSRDNW